MKETLAKGACSVLGVVTALFVIWELIQWHDKNRLDNAYKNAMLRAIRDTYNMLEVKEVEGGWSGWVEQYDPKGNMIRVETTPIEPASAGAVEIVATSAGDDGLFGTEDDQSRRGSYGVVRGVVNETGYHATKGALRAIKESVKGE